MNTRVCKVCAIEKPFIRNGKYKYGGIRYIDGDGKRWNSKTCYQCHRAGVLACSARKTKRLKRSVEE